MLGRKENIINETTLRKIVKESINRLINESVDVDNFLIGEDNFSVCKFYTSDDNDMEYIRKHKDEIWNVLQNGYESLGGFKGFGSRKDMLKKSSMVILGFKNDEIITVAVYNPYLGGNKCVGMACVKDENHDNSVALLNLIIKHNIKNIKDWVWVEASGGIEKYFRKNGGFNVPSRFVPLFILNIPFTPLNEYYYERSVGGVKTVKTLFGFKDMETFEVLKNELTSDMNNYLNSVGISIVDESVSDTLNNYYNSLSDEEKNCGVINYFIYLKYDEEINEFPEECIQKLKQAILFMKKCIKENEYTKDEKRRYDLLIKEGNKIIRTSTILKPLKLVV